MRFAMNDMEDDMEKSDVIEKGNEEPAAEADDGTGEESVDGAGALQSELTAAKAEAEENQNRFLKKSAEFENLKKRTLREKAAHTSFANEELISAILVPIDNLESALAHAGDRVSGDGDVADGGGNGGATDTIDAPDAIEAVGAIKDGIKLTLSDLYAELARFGLEEVEACGVKFDPSVHEAISHEDTADSKSDMVIKVLRKGFTLNGRLLRPAMVIVAK